MTRLLADMNSNFNWIYSYVIEMNTALNGFILVRQNLRQNSKT